jgi:heme-degrading monooxygenase HmoA
MTEFLDFLRHQFAYVAIGEFKLGKFEEAKQLYEQAVSTYGQGFQGAYLLQEPGSDRGIAVIFWSSMGDMEANQNEACQAILDRMSPLFAHTPKTAFYEVVSTTKAPDLAAK